LARSKSLIAKKGTSTVNEGMQPPTSGRNLSSRPRHRFPKVFPQKNLLAGDLSEFNQISKEVFNEVPYCELVSANIVETRKRARFSFSDRGSRLSGAPYGFDHG
jgi:hypothetical protein